ncbi:SDR family NAD(P)-dependent oxidoreductase [Hirschia litorea]|uniref:SDR family NAD(P)-dependent oxidoreductase n=1 Tax=Hirschia litorea TaxID=1199156 RepID=A0ABW2IPL1_9PROT
MTSSYLNFKGKHIIVTGAASGIGKSIALAFAAHGGQVSAWDINESGLSDLKKGQPNITCFVCDLTQIDQIEKAYTDCIQQNGSPSVLVNNAGVDRRIPLSSQSSEDWQWMMSANLNHQAALSALAAKSLEKAGGGAIINLTSTAWMKLAGNLTAYHAAKAGIVGLTRGLARDLGPSKIRVNAIAPGRIFTDRAAAQVNNDWIEETKNLQCIPELIPPEAIADAALWLACDASRFITGQTIIIDGGVV